LVVRKLPPPKRNPILPRRGGSEPVAEEQVVDQPGGADGGRENGEPSRGPEVVRVDELGVVGPDQRLAGQLALDQLPEHRRVVLSAEVGVVGEAERPREDERRTTGLGVEIGVA